MATREQFAPDPRPDWASRPSGLTREGVVAAFDAATPYTVGVEEELMLLDPETLRLAPLVEPLLARLDGDTRFVREMRASAIESVSAIHANAAEAEHALADARRALLAAADGIAAVAAAGTHPLTTQHEADVSNGERYTELVEQYAWATRGMMCGLHVHVAVGDADRALAVFNALRGYAPEIAALAANSPFYGGLDTGLASIRPVLNAVFPRAGVPPVLESWQQYVDLLEWGRRGGSFPDETYLWWEIRPSPRFGTLELRVPDAATSAEDVGAIAAVCQSLVAWLGERHDAGEALPAYDQFRIGENAWSALRYGLGGWLLDLDTGEPHPARACVEKVLREIEPVAERLGCGQQLEHARTLLAGNGAERQRYVHERDGMDGLLRWLIAASRP
jgi:carboxylate-amine ligase